MIDETQNNDLSFATISSAALKPENDAPAFRPDYYIRVMGHQGDSNAPIDMTAIFNAIKAANLQAQSDIERWGKDKTNRENIVNVRQDETGLVVAVINKLGYNTDEDEWEDDNEDDDEEEDGEDDDGAW